MDDRVYRIVNIPKDSHKKLKLLAYKKNCTIYDLVNKSIKKQIEKEGRKIQEITSTNSETYAVRKLIIEECKEYCKENKLTIKQLLTHSITSLINYNRS